MLLQAARRTGMRWRTTPTRWSDRLETLAKEVRRDIHKMHAFVRFREVETEAARASSPSSSPSITSSAHAAGFFVRRFTNMRWSILTPELSIHWDGETLTEGPGATRADAPAAIRSRRCGRPITRPSSTRRG